MEAQKFLDAFNGENARISAYYAQTIEGIKQHWSQLSGPERAELIAQGLSEGIGTFIFPGLWANYAGSLFKYTGTKLQAWQLSEKELACIIKFLLISMLQSIK